MLVKRQYRVGVLTTQPAQGHNPAVEKFDGGYVGTTVTVHEPSLHPLCMVDEPVAGLPVGRSVRASAGSDPTGRCAREIGLRVGHPLVPVEHSTRGDQRVQLYVSCRQRRRRFLVTSVGPDQAVVPEPCWAPGPPRMWLAGRLYRDVLLGGRRGCLFGDGHVDGQDALVVAGFDVVFVGAGRQGDRAGK